MVSAETLKAALAPSPGPRRLSRVALDPGNSVREKGVSGDVPHPSQSVLSAFASANEQQQGRPTHWPSSLGRTRAMRLQGPTPERLGEPRSELSGPSRPRLVEPMMLHRIGFPMLAMSLAAGGLTGSTISYPINCPLAHLGRGAVAVEKESHEKNRSATRTRTIGCHRPSTVPDPLSLRRSVRRAETPACVQYSSGQDTSPLRHTKRQRHDLDA
jgi:hypothetical protein